MFFVRSFFHLLFHSVYDRFLCLLDLSKEEKKRMEPQQRIPLRPLPPLNYVNRPPVQQQALFRVNKIVGFLDNSNGVRYCSLFPCGGLAVFKCKLVVSGNYRHYCYRCFEHYRTDVVVCEADSTGTED